MIGASYADAGVSGITLQRPELQRLIADCLAGLINTVITLDPDRLSRDRSQLRALLIMFRNADVTVEYSREAHCENFHETVLSAVEKYEEAKRRSSLAR